MQCARGNRTRARHGHVNPRKRDCFGAQGNGAAIGRPNRGCGIAGVGKTEQRREVNQTPHVIRRNGNAPLVDDDLAKLDLPAVVSLNRKWASVIVERAQETGDA